MVKISMRVVLAALALLLAACAGGTGSEPVVRNSLGVPVDPQTGIPLPGAPGAGGGGGY